MSAGLALSGSIFLAFEQPGSRGRGLLGLFINCRGIFLPGNESLAGESPEAAKAIGEAGFRLDRPPRGRPDSGAPAGLQSGRGRILTSAMSGPPPLPLPLPPPYVCMGSGGQRSRTTGRQELSGTSGPKKETLLRQDGWILGLSPQPGWAAPTASLSLQKHHELLAQSRSRQTLD